MKIHTVENRADVTGAKSVKEFGINFNAKMAGILSDGLYSYKIRAIIRELSTNAVDSHKAAGHNKPFDIHLPNWKEPYFYIRDYGTGLSKDDVENIYSVYGQSNKENSNEFVGCLGLGSKTPFSYHTRTFTVESYYNGKRYMYNCYRNDMNMPTVALVYEGDTTEPNGVKIQVPTESYDEYEFQREAQYVYRFFNEITPRISGNHVNIVKPTYTLKGDKWGYVGGSESLLIMGGVCYPIKINLANCDSVLDNGFHIYAEIGDVDIQPSREGLSYDPTTKAYIQRRCSKIITEITDIASKSIANANSLWEAMCLYNDLHSILPNELKKCVDIKQLTYNGKELPLNALGFIDLTDLFKEQENYIRYFEYCAYKSTSPKKEVVSVFPKKDEKFILDDLTVGAISRAQYYTNTNHKSSYLIRTSKLQELCDFTGLQQSDFILASSLPVSSVRGPSASRGKLDSVVKLKLGPTQKTQCWENTSINLDDGGIYVKFLRYDLSNKNDNYINPYELVKLQNYLNTLGITMPDVYGVKAKEVSELPDGWVSFWDWLQGELDKIKLTTNYQQCKNYQDETNYYQYRYNNYLDYLTFDGELFDLLREKHQIAQNGLKELDKIGALRYIESSWGLTVQTNGKVNKLGLKNTYDEIHQKFPLLKRLTGYFRTEQVEIQNYINLIEEKSECLS